jgi:hypothetical protein
MKDASNEAKAAWFSTNKKTNMYRMRYSNINFTGRYISSIINKEKPITTIHYI